MLGISNIRSADPKSQSSLAQENTYDREQRRNDDAEHQVCMPSQQPATNRSLLKLTYCSPASQAGRQDLAAYNRVRESDASIGNDLKVRRTSLIRVPYLCTANCQATANCPATGNCLATVTYTTLVLYMSQNASAVALLQSVLTQQVRSEPESQYTSSGGQHVRQYSSASPSSKWSTASPSASWGTTQPDATKQPWLYGTVQSSSDRTLMDKAKEYLPGTGSGTADNSAQPSLLEKAKEYLPGASNTRSTGSWQGSDRSGLQQESATGGITVCIIINLGLCFQRNFTTSVWPCFDLQLAALLIPMCGASFAAAPFHHSLPISLCCMFGMCYCFMFLRASHCLLSCGCAGFPPDKHI